MRAYLLEGVLVACYLMALGASQYISASSILLEVFSSHLSSSFLDHRRDTHLDYEFQNWLSMSIAIN